MDSLKYKRRRPTKIILNGDKRHFHYEVKEVILAQGGGGDEPYVENNALNVFGNEIQNHTLSGNGFSISDHTVII